jgi:hypothetical protein
MQRVREVDPRRREEGERLLYGLLAVHRDELVTTTFRSRTQRPVSVPPAKPYRSASYG